jgi:hypothetical protein
MIDYWFKFEWEHDVFGDIVNGLKTGPTCKN